MEYSNSHYFGLKKSVVSILHHVALFAMLHSSFVAPVQGIIDAYIHNKKPVKYTGFSNNKAVYNSIANQNQVQSQTVYPGHVIKDAKSMVGVAKGSNVFLFNADIKEGVIGVSKEKPIDSPSDNLFKINLDQLPLGNDKVYLTYEVFGVADHQSVARSINDRLSVGGHLVKKQQGWSAQKEEMNPSWLHKGLNTILFTIPNGADYQYKIRNLSIHVEKNQTVNSLLVVHSQTVTFSKDNKVYVKGFLRGNYPEAKVEANQTMLQVSNNEFEGFINLTDDIKRNGLLMLKATQNGQLLGQEIVFVDNNAIEADRIFVLEKKEAIVSKLFKAGISSRLDTDGASIMATDSTLAKDYELSVSRLRNIDIAPMESGMINVTKGGRGYRFLPDGTKFEKPVSLSIEYDSKLLPTGYTTKDIRTYYFDTNNKRWIAVEKDSIDVKNNVIISKTTHFTDYINGIIQAPDSPETSAFTPTMMSDVKAADPSAEMTLVSPPSASQKGDANISYPIKLPSGRRGMQPQLALQYTSEGGNGWLGNGWSLSIPAITLDTRWGTPLFDPAKETEIYSLNGEQLMYQGGYLPHRHRDLGAGAITTDYIDRNTGGTKTFFPRKQGSFTKIERLGNTPQTYYWKVTSTDGTIYWYGGKTAALDDFVIKDDRAAHNIVHWALYMVEDLYGNNIKYSYQKETMGSNIAANPGLEGGRFFEIEHIYYTGKDEVNGNYRVDFEKEPSVVRTDLTIDARLGVKRVWPYRLKNISVNYLPDANPLIRKYSIDYETGKLGKSRPTSITESSGDGQFSYTHTFEYYNDITREDGVDVYFGGEINTTICVEGESTCPDTDGDGVCNSDDACPTLFGPASNFGCPDPENEHCYITSFRIYKGKAVRIKINGYEILYGPFTFPYSNNQFIDGFTTMFPGYTITVGETSDGISLTISGTGTPLLTISTYFDPGVDIYHYAVNDLRFNSCKGPRPAGLTTFNTPPSSGIDYSYHSFYDHIKNNFTIGFSGAATGGNPDCPWLINYDFLMQGYMPSFISAPAALGSSKSEGFGFGGYIGVGIGGNPASKPTTLGGQYTHSEEKGTGYVASVDITGDGLEDIVIRDNDILYYKKHVVTRTYDSANKEIVTHSFEAKTPIEGINEFYRSSSETDSFNFQVTFKAFAGGSATVDSSHTSSETDIYFTDANGDGLIDIVKNEVVYFNYINNGIPKFEPDSKKTENMVVTAKAKEITIPNEYFDQEVKFPQHDIVKVWEAPASGKIKITNDIELTDTTKEATVTIETKKFEPTCYSTSFIPPIYYTYRYGTVSVSFAVADPSVSCYSASACLGSLSPRFYGGGMMGVQHPAPANMYMANGDINGTANMCPGAPYNFCGPTPYYQYCSQIASPDFRPRFMDWFVNDLLVGYDHTGESGGGGASLSCYQGMLTNYMYGVDGYFYSIDPNITGYLYSGFPGLISEKPPTQTYYEFDLTNPDNWMGCMPYFKRYNVPQALETSITIDGNTLGIYSLYNLGSGFHNFRDDFEAAYPGSSVTRDEATQVITIISPNPVNTISLIPTSDPSQADTYNFELGECDLESTLNPLVSTLNAKTIKDIRIDDKQLEINYKHWVASGNELSYPIDDVPLVFSRRYQGIKYFAVVYKKQITWENEKRSIIDDRSLTGILTDLLPSNIEELYLEFQKKVKEDETNLRKENYKAARIELKSDRIPEDSVMSSFTTLSSSLGCNPQTGDLCVLYGEKLNAGNSIINKVITNYSQECDQFASDIYVRKGQKIYFRVHSTDGGNAKINWDPAVEYVGLGMSSIVDQNGETPFASRYSDGFVLSGASPLVFPGNGVAEISWPTLIVGNPSDEVTYEIYKKELTGPEENYDDIQPIPIYKRTCPVGVSTTVSPTINEISGINISSITVETTNTNSQDPKVTLFYFKVTSTSNVRWKQLQWRPKVVCVTKNTIVDENQTIQGTADFTDVRYPLPDYSIYKSFVCSSRYNIYNVSLLDTENDNLGIIPDLSTVSFAGLEGKLFFVVKRGGHFLGRRIFTINNNSINIDDSSAIDLSGGGEIEIGYYSDDSAESDIDESLLNRLASSSDPLAIITDGSSFNVSVYKQSVNLFHKPFPKFGPMYRQWGQFAYNPAGITDAEQSDYGPLINEEKLVITDENSQALQDAASAAENQFSNVNLETHYESFINDMDQFEADNQQLMSVPFIPLMGSRNLSPSEGYQEKWQGLHAESYASEISYRAATMDQAYSGIDQGDQDTEQEVLKTGAYGITRYSTGKGKNLSGGVGFGAGAASSVGVSGSKSIDGASNMLTDYVDLNGDRYPDIVSTTHVQYTTKAGGLTDTAPLNGAYNGNLGDYSNSSWGIGASGSVAVGGKAVVQQDPTSKRPKYSSFRGSNSIGISGNYASGDSYTKKMWTDINGDGLADLLARDPLTGNVSVKINLGDARGPMLNGTLSPWTSFELSKGRSNSVGGGIGGSLWNGSIEFGASINRGNNHTDTSLTDMDGDGLADLVSSDSNGLKVRLNRGGNFGPEVSWSDYTLENNYETVSMSSNAGLSLAWVIGIPFTSFSIKPLAVNANGTPYTTATNNTKKSITDYDGDGYPDLLQEISSGYVRIRPSNIRRTDMLKSVSNPLGGKFTVDYKVITPSYGNPSAKWVMKSVVVEDGYDLVNDGADNYTKNFEYENGYHDRREREFYGYEKVKTIDNIVDAQGQITGIYRTAVSEYNNKSYYLNGMVKSSYVMRGSDISKLYSKSLNSYKLKALDMATGIIDMNAAVIPLTFDTGGTEGRKAAAVLMESTENYIYEFGGTPLVSRVEFTYNDPRGRITKYDYKGDITKAEDNYTAEIEYFSDTSLEAKNIFNIPSRIRVKDHNNVELRSRMISNIDPNTGFVTAISSKIVYNDWATTSMEHDVYGNLSQVTLPPNENSQQFSYTYQYDTDNYKLPVRVEDSFGYVSETSYNYKFDKVTKSTDITDNITLYTYDSFGRMLTIQGPKEIEVSVPYTISFAYYPKQSELTAAYGCADEENFMPVAVTSHYDAQHPTNDIQTYTFIDGMARPVQVKKDIEINTGDNANPNLSEAVSVSGKTFYDQYGRALKQYHPYFENKECGLNLRVNEYDSPNVAKTEYDEMDRPVLSVDYDENTTTVSYTMGDDYNNTLSLKTITEIQQNDSETIVSVTVKDINGRVTAQVPILSGANGGALWTRFEYNAIGELMSYTDPQDLSTTYQYDMLGRKTEIVHPDNGKTTYQYDLAGNLTKVQTAFLASNSLLQPQNRYIKYFYDYNRLSKIMYPDMPIGENISNVDYEYGSTGNDTGRLITQVDATGAQHFEYGNMGEMIHNKRIVVGPNIPTRTFETSFTYDSWNRIQDITYPDGEVVSHQYNLGGNLVKITGDLAGSPYDYIQRIDYDYFEQKTYQLYGNGTDMAYAYTLGMRRLKTMVARTSGQQNFLDNSYSYDKIGNVISLHNNATPNSNNMMGGNYSHIYTYDNLNRLINAHGDFSGDSSQQNNNNDYTSDYVLDIDYNATHGIAHKKQQHNKNTQQVAQNIYENGYEYNEGTHMIETITDANTQAVTKYTYDVDGNIFSIYDSSTGTLKRMFWDESKRLRVFFDDIQMQHYIYDANGERVLKGTAKPESIYENGMPQSGTLHFNSYTTYPSAYIVVNPDGKFSKHYYAGSQRIVSRIGDSDASIFEKKKRATATAPTEGETTTFDEEDLRQQQIGDLTQIFAKAELGVPVFSEYQPADEDETDEQEEESAEAGRTAQRGPSAAGLYYYHPDHLGTSTFLTDANGELYQFFLNLPFGETMAEQHSLTEDYETPYKFNGKELDSETGLYYYGARYYDPRASIWLSTDPLMYKYPDVNPYVYCMQNPILYKDPDGREIRIWYINELGKEVYYTYIYDPNKKLPSNSKFLENSVKTLDRLIEKQAFKSIIINGKCSNRDRLVDIVNNDEVLAMVEGIDDDNKPSYYTPYTYNGDGKYGRRGLGTLVFDDDNGIEFFDAEGKVQTNSPMAQIAHEILHEIHHEENEDEYKARKDLKNYVPGHGTPEEQQTVKEANPINRSLGEPERPDYRGKNVRMANPIINKKD